MNDYDKKNRIGLNEKLACYAKSDYYPFHMPGHKRADLGFENPYKIDITEIDGFDNLHQAEGILLELQERLRDLCNSKKSYYLINGSTCGILSAIGALTKSGDTIIMARNCHKSVYNAVKLFKLKSFYVYPERMICGIQGDIKPNLIEDALKKNQNAKLVIITSPTYDGIVSDVKKIAEIAHKYHAYLIVDEAHGAHFSFSEYFPESAIGLGADIIIQSFHKTLPSFTQTAVLHIAGNRVAEEKIEEMLTIFQSSSPSYILMAGIAQCVQLLEQSGKRLFYEYQKKLEVFYHRCSQLQHLHVLTDRDYLPYHVYNIDKSKILVCTKNTFVSGKTLYQKLLDCYHLQMEMHSSQYVLGMTSIMDTQEGFDRLVYALHEIDQTLNKESSLNRDSSYDLNYDHDIEISLKDAYAPRKKIMEISEVDDYLPKQTQLEDCIGKASAEYIYLYPPGIPMIVPGEVITKQLIDALQSCKKLGLNVQGMKDANLENIRTVSEQ